MLRDLRRQLHAFARPAKAEILRGFFKTGQGEYGEGDRFLGIQVPVLRSLARVGRGATLAQIRALLASPWHEERLLGLLMLVETYRTGDESTRQRVYDLYLASTDRVNNWDLVDLSAPNIVGTHLLDRSRAPLLRLARSRSLWERRIAIVATHAFIRRGEFDDTLRIADRLLADRHDLIHKAVGWMLREVGKRDRAALESFLTPRCRVMPRTMLRYAIERFPPAVRRRYLQGKFAASLNRG